MWWFCWNLHQSLLKESKTLFQEFFWKFKFLPKKDVPKVCTFFSFCLTLRPFLSVKEAKIQKNKYFKDKTMPSGYPKIVNSRPYLVPMFQEKYDYFLSYFGCFLVKKGAWSHFKGSESKFDLPYCSLTIVGHVSVQKVWFQHFPVLRL